MHCSEGHWAAPRSYRSRRYAPGLLAALLPTPSPNQINLAGARGDKLVVVAKRGDKLVILKPSLLAANVAISLFDPRSSLGSSTATFTNSTSLQGDAPTRSLPLAVAGNPPNIPPLPSRGERVAQKVVLPMPRPASAPRIAADRLPAFSRRFSRSSLASLPR